MIEHSNLFEDKILLSIDQEFIIGITNQIGNFIYVNDNFCKIFKYERFEILEKNLSLLKSSHHSEKFYEEVWNCLKSGKTWSGEVKITDKEGVIFWSLASISPFINKNPDLSQYVFIFYDISEKKLFEQKMAAQKLSIDQAMVELEMRERFFSGLSHDLKTPITIAKISAQLIRKKFFESDKIVKLTNKINENLNRVDGMINELLDANRNRSLNQYALKFTEFDIKEVVQETLENLVQIHGDRFKLIDNGSCVGSWCVSGIIRILENLTNNAIKYGDSDTPVIIKLNTSNDHLTLSVHNMGNPITETDQRNIFDYLQRTSAAENSNQNGWGLGLTVVKGMALAHGGNVRVFSFPNEGTTFTVTLPIDSKAKSIGLKDNF